MTVTRAGTSTVDLGEAPDGADHLDIRLTCLTAGSFVLDGGASMVCTTADAARSSVTSGYTHPLTEGQRSVRVTAGPTERWTLS